MLNQKKAMKSTMKQIYGLIVLGMIIIMTTACEKYDEGGLVSKASKRLTENGWRLESYYRNGNDETTQLMISAFEENFIDGGDLTRSYIDKDGKPFTENGSWTFDNDKQQINITGVGSIDLTDETTTVSTSDYNIIKLTKDELWYVYENGSDMHEFHLYPK
jgi:hypothetical protein